MQQINHTEYQANLKGRPSAELHFIISDCRAAIAAFPFGEKAGYYADEIHYAAAELAARAKAAK